MNKTYLISCDLHKRFKQIQLCDNLHLPDDTDNFFHDFQLSIAKTIQQIYPSDEVKLVMIESMTQEVLNLANKKQLDNDGFVVSTSVDFSVPKRGYTLEVNRLVNGHGSIIGIGTRPGHDTLRAQCAQISALANNKPVIIIEDGIFTGGTIEHIVMCLKNSGVTVTNVVSCFASSKGIDYLNKVLGDIEVDFVHHIENLIDWIPDHDLFPGAPNCGRVMGVNVLNSFVPFYDKNGTSFSFPYITPFAPITDWASIPKKWTYLLSSFCLRRACDFFESLDMANGGKQITFAQLQKINPRISIPISVDTTALPDKFTGISGYLKSILTESY